MGGYGKDVATIERSIDIDAPATRVWDVLEDVRRLPEYSESTSEVRDAPKRLTAVGQEYVQVGRLLGVKLTSRWRVAAIEPDRMISSEGTPAAGVRYCLTQRLEPRGEAACRLSITIDYDVPGGALGRFAARAGAESRAAREAEQVLAGIKRTVETQR